MSMDFTINQLIIIKASLELHHICITEKVVQQLGLVSNQITDAELQEVALGLECMIKDVAAELRRHHEPRETQI